MALSTVFISAGYFYLKSKITPVTGNASSVPYSPTPESTGILLEICEEKTLLYFDFEENILSVICADGIAQKEIYGYRADYTVKGDYSLVGYIVDTLYGIDLEGNGEILSYTGSQIEEMLSTTADLADLRRTVTEKIIFEISQKGFSKENFLYIIENSKTDLTLPICYYWSDSMKDICKNVRLIGFESTEVN